MKRHFIKLLQKTKEKLEDADSKKLIDRILEYNGEIENLPLDYLLPVSNQDDEQKGKESNKNRIYFGPEIKDFRIKSLSLSNFRTYPKQKGKAYGLSFCNKEQKDEDMPCSLFLVGKNGTGKSTIFDALELIYAGKVSNAQVRGIKKQEDLLKYLTYGFETIPSITRSEVKLGIKFADAKADEENLSLDDISAYGVPALCCSDWDIEVLSKIEDESDNRFKQSGMSDMQKFVAEQLGYEDYIALKDRLETIQKHILEEQYNISNVQKLKYLNTDNLNGVRVEFLKIISKGKGKVDTAINKIDYYIDYYFKDNETKLSIRTDLSRIDSKEFSALWTNLKNAITTLQQSKISRTNFLENNNAEPDSNFNDNLDAKTEDECNVIIKSLGACYKRLQQALKEYKLDENNIGIEKALGTLSDDLDFFKDKTDYFKKYATKEEADKIINDYGKLNSQIAAIVNFMTVFIKNIFSTIPKDFKDYSTNEDIEVKIDADGAKIMSPLTEFIEKTLRPYAESGEDIKIECTSNSFKVNITVKDGQTQKYKTTPRKYYNTFRFKLYAISLKIALAFYYMKTHECYAPIVIDDVFNASDFENSVNLYSFVHKIYEIYQTTIDIHKQRPLQLIILTHEELVLNALQDGAIYSGINYISGRLFQYKFACDIETECKKMLPYLNLYINY